MVATSGLSISRRARAQPSRQTRRLTPRRWSPDVRRSPRSDREKTTRSIGGQPVAPASRSSFARIRRVRRSSSPIGPPMDASSASGRRDDVRPASQKSSENADLQRSARERGDLQPFHPGSVRDCQSSVFTFEHLIDFGKRTDPLRIYAFDTVHIERPWACLRPT